MRICAASFALFCCLRLRALRARASASHICAFFCRSSAPPAAITHSSACAAGSALRDVMSLLLSCCRRKMAAALGVSVGWRRERNGGGENGESVALTSVTAAKCRRIETNHEISLAPGKKALTCSAACQRHSHRKKHQRDRDAHIRALDGGRSKPGCGWTLDASHRAFGYLTGTLLPGVDNSETRGCGMVQRMPPGGMGADAILTAGNDLAWRTRPGETYIIHDGLTAGRRRNDEGVTWRVSKQAAAKMPSARHLCCASAAAAKLPLAYLAHHAGGSAAASSARRKRAATSRQHGYRQRRLAARTALGAEYENRRKAVSKSRMKENGNNGVAKYEREKQRGGGVKPA